MELVRTDVARGYKVIDAFTTPAQKLYVTYQCKGPGKLAFGDLFTIGPCDGQVGTVTLLGQAGRHETTRVVASPDTKWRVLVERPVA